MNNQLNTIFNITPANTELVEVKEIKSVSEYASDPTIDFGKARENLDKVLDTASDAVQAAAIIAGSAQTPEMFMALSSLINAATKAAQAKMSLHKDLQSIGKGEGPSELHNHVHFSGSTEELSKMLKGNK